MKLENVVPWGRNLEEYQTMFLLSNQDLESKILGCGDGPSSFNFEATQQNINITSIDPIYNFTKDEIQQRIDETSAVISEQLKHNQKEFIWKSFKSIDELIAIRLKSMCNFINDYEDGKAENRYIYNELPKLSFENDSFDLVLSSHFLFLYSEHFDLQFHIDSILEMCRVSKKDVRIFPLLNLENKRSKHLKPTLEVLNNQGFQTKIIKTDYEFQKGANEMLNIRVDKKMRVEEIEAKTLYGISTRTKNVDEMNPQTAKIAALWQKFDDTVDVDYKAGERVYGAYYNYESDANGEFDVLGGYETFNEKLESVKIEKGNYLVFSKAYKENSDKYRVQAVIETWGEIWKYFSNENSQYKRAYKTDFEYYKNQNEIEIYISIIGESMDGFDPIAYKNMVKTYQEKDDPLGWFDSIYTDAKGDYKSVFWADLEPSPYLVAWLEKHTKPLHDSRAIVVGCGVGDDAEALSAFGYNVTAFDISPEAIKLCKKRYPDSKVNYHVENLFDYPKEWRESFDVVYECNTIQVLPHKYRLQARDAMISFLDDNAHILVSCRSRNEGEQLDDIPLPLDKKEIDGFVECGLKERSFFAYDDENSVPHFFATYQK